MLLALLMVWLPNVVMADSGKLQSLLDNLSKSQTRATTIYDIDLSTMSDADKMLTTTLEVRNGLHVRFINGTLTRTSDATGPMVRVTNNSALEIGKGAIFFNNGTDHTPSSNIHTPNTSPIVNLLKGGIIVSSNGQILMSSDSKTKGVSMHTSIMVTKEVDHPIAIGDDGCFVKMESTAKIEGNILSSCASSKIYISSGTIETITVKGQKSEVFIDGGKVASITSSSPISISGGEVDRVHSTEVLLSGKAQVSDFYNCKIRLTSSLEHNIVFHSGYITNHVVAVGENYQITEADFKKMSLQQIPDNGVYNMAFNALHLVLENNEVSIKRKTYSLSDKIQVKLDEIAAKGTSTKNQPEKISLGIPVIGSSEAIIDKMITVPANCYAVIVQGPTFKVSKSIPEDIIFDVQSNAGISFENITFDGSDIIKGGTWFRLKDKTSSAIIGSGCKFNIAGCRTDVYTHESNMNLCVGNGSFTYQSGVFSSLQPAIKGNGTIYIQGGDIYSKSTVITANSLYIGDGSIHGGYGSSDYIVDVNNLVMKGGELHSLIRSNMIFADFETAEIYGDVKLTGTNGMVRVSKKLSLDGGSYIIPTIYMQKDANLYLGQNADLTYTLEGDWKNYTLNNPFITHVGGGLKQLNFVKLPDDIEPNFNANTWEVMLWNKKQKLQDWLDNLPPKGSDTTGPIDYPIPSGGIDADGEGSFGEGLQGILDGLGQDGCNLPFYVGEKTIVKIPPYSIITMRNLDFKLKEGANSNGYIYVSGTLIIDVNINITRIYHLIRVLPGGRVIWKDGNGTGTDITKEFIYVETGGTLEYHGGTIRGGELGFHGYGTTFIYGGNIGGTKYGGYTYPSGTTTISGGTISGGYYNGGKTIISGGTFIGGGSGIGDYVYWNGKGGTTTITGGTFGTSGNGTIYNGGNLYLGGNGYTYDYIYNGASGRIYIIGKLNIIIRIHINITDIVLDTPIILGGSDYVLTAEDIKKIQIILPDGYTWRYDASRGGIIITSTTGIKDVTVDADNEAQYFDASGRKIEKLQKGLNIVKTSDGKTKKVMIK